MIVWTDDEAERRCTLCGIWWATWLDRAWHLVVEHGWSGSRLPHPDDGQFYESYPQGDK
jgi:hypothetical protein